MTAIDVTQLERALQSAVERSPNALLRAGAAIGMTGEQLAGALSLALRDLSSRPTSPPSDVDGPVREAVLAERARLSALILAAKPTIARYAGDTDGAVGLCALLLRLDAGTLPLDQPRGEVRDG